MKFLDYRFRFEREGHGRYLRLLVRIFGRGRWGHHHEHGYLVLRLCGPALEFESPSDWHEERRCWVRASFVLGTLALSFPWRGKVPKDDGQCSGPTYGFAFREDALWLFHGKAKACIKDDHSRTVLTYPWAWSHVRHDYVSLDGSITRRTRSYREDCPAEWRETHLYTYVRKNGEQQQRQATIYRERREWRWYWFRWLPFPRMVRHSINVAFDGEIGERTGTWKGGTIGCGYDLKRGETPLECLRRMERERVEL